MFNITTLHLTHLDAVWMALLIITFMSGLMWGIFIGELLYKPKRKEL